jgi:Tol biopolymer transport system component
MKPLKVLIAVVFIAAVAALPAPALDMTDYGTKLNIVWTDLPTHHGEPLEVQQNPVWSPDGKTIAFNGNGGSDIFTIPAGGGAPTLIYENRGKKLGYPDISGNFNTCGGMSTLCYTPDGKEICFMDDMIDASLGSSYTTKMMYNGREWYEYIATLFHPIVLARSVNIATGAVRNLVIEAQEAALSPDGRYIAYYWVSWKDIPATNTTAFPSHALKILDLKTGETKTLDSEGYGPGFTPDSKYVLYSSTSVNSTNIMNSIITLNKIAVTGGTPERVTSTVINQPISGIYGPKVSPDGKWILFIYRTSPSHTKVYQHLCALNTTTKEAFDLFPNSYNASLKSYISIESYEWSPDGKKIAYQPKIHADDTSSGIGTNYGNIYILDFPPKSMKSMQVMTAVAETAPVNFSITGNFPNPFNPTTTISFTLPETGQTSLTVYNVQGQKVRELASGTLSAGMHSVVWDGCDMNGNHVSSGIYFSRLTMKDKIATSKMLLTK